MLLTANACHSPATLGRSRANQFPVVSDEPHHGKCKIHLQRKFVLPTREGMTDPPSYIAALDFTLSRLTDSLPLRREPNQLLPSLLSNSWRS